jgi:hypothetical protein
MATAPKWITPPGFVGTLTQGVSSSLLFNIQDASQFNVIGGELPGFFSLFVTTGTSVTPTVLEVKGTPYVYNENISTTFVLRAKNITTGLVTDRTFRVDVTGPTDPDWITPEGYLQVGPNLEPYVLNKNRVDILLQASQSVIPKGQKLTYYIAENDGQLPPGLRLNEANGLINGYVADELSLDFLASAVGGYDAESYDAYPYDHVVVIRNQNQGRPISISKVYQFYVTVTDGISSSRRKFKIRVEDPNAFRADTTQIDSDTRNYLANIGYLIPPIWLNVDNSILPNPSNLGTLRANNNQLIDLNVYDPYPFVGPVTFDWDLLKVNPEIRAQTTSRNNEVGYPTVNLAGQRTIYLSKAIGTPYGGMKIQLNPYVPFASDKIYTIAGVEEFGGGWKLNLTEGLLYSIPDLTTIYFGTLSSHPPGLTLDPDTGLLYGRLPYQPAYSISYRFTVRIVKTDQETNNTVSNDHIFNLVLKGDIETTIRWTTASDLGYINPGHISDLSVEAVHTSANLSVSYSLTGGKLPPGLSLTSDGNISGKIPYNIQTNFDTAASGFGFTTFDQKNTTFDKVYKFNVTARDSFLLSAVSRDFILRIVETSINSFTDISVSPLLSRTQRQYFKSLVEDATIFDTRLLYKLDDPNFGIQNQIKMTIEFGIESINLDNYVPALTNYFKRKRYYFGEVKSAQAIDSKGNVLYDVVYVDIIDDQMIGNKISVDPSFTRDVNGTTVTYYPDTVINEQYALESIEIGTQHITVDDQLRPKFMQTLQKSTGIPLGFVKAFIICYTLPGKSSDIVNNINRSDFDFTNIDFDIDRISIENSLDQGKKYLVFGTGSTDTAFYITSEDDEDLLTEDSNPLSL